MGYSLMIAPFDFANHNKIAAQQFFDNYAFFELTPKRAKEYFLWFKFDWHNIQGNRGTEFLKNLQREQKTQDDCPCFLEAGLFLIEDWRTLPCR